MSLCCTVFNWLKEFAFSLFEKYLNVEDRNVVNTMVLDSLITHQFRNLFWQQHVTLFVPTAISIITECRCGLVALKHAADILRASQSQLTLNKTSENEIAELLQLSIDSGFTYRGEMFSARDMGFLAKKYYDINYKVFGSGLKDYASLVNHLVQGYPVVVPYDSDRNNEPCLKKGHKAHWAVITGEYI